MSKEIDQLDKSDYLTFEEFEEKEETFCYFIDKDGTIYVKLPDDERDGETMIRYFYTFADVEAYLDDEGYVGGQRCTS